MIVAEQKSIDRIREMLKGYRKVLAVGCGTCVTVCFAGGRKEVGILASSLRMASGIDGEPLEVDETSVQRQCEKEFIDPLADLVADYDAILSLGCGVGVQSLADRFPDKRILPGLNTKFMGGPSEQGVWEERCQGCGSCVLDITGGICPVSRCAKQLMNGPCGGVENGRCEVDESIPCAWCMIWKRMEGLGLRESLMEVQPPKDWSTSRDGGLRKVVREDLKAPQLEEEGEGE
jgi:ferredoxin